MKNPKVRFRAPHNKENPYTVVSSALIFDGRLTPLAREILLQIQGDRSDYAPFCPEDFISPQKGHSRDSVYDAFRLCRRLGYIKRQDFVKDGIRYYEYTYHEMPPAEERIICVGPERKSPTGSEGGASTEKAHTKSIISVSLDAERIGSPASEALDRNHSEIMGSSLEIHRMPLGGHGKDERSSFPDHDLPLGAICENAIEGL